ncbi:MAG: hypothetical protein ABL994_07400, partial [Verrucomicrobiales bacterium]
SCLTLAVKAGGAEVVTLEGLANDPITVQYYDWNKETLSWTKELISDAPAGQGPGIGLQIRVNDLDGNGFPDIAVPGKSGTHIIWNEGWTKPS